MAADFSSRNGTIEQACAVPYRWKSRRIEFCLITASSGRWMFPKGFIETGDTFASTALKEAKEEAGLHGRVVPAPIGCYEIEKKGRLRTVIALLMEVTKCDDDWPEADTRLRQWASAQKARRLVSEPDLQTIIRSAESRLRIVQ